MNNFPVTVLMPVYNGQQYLTEAIESILNQSFRDFEFLIINDGSTDKSKDIILSYNDPRIRYVENEKNIRLIATLNKGLDLVRGKYIARMDADDISLPQRLETQFEYMESNSETGLCGSWLQTIGDEDRIIRFKALHYEIRMELFFHPYLHHPTAMIRNSVLKDNNIRYPDVLHAEDYAMWVKLSDYTRFYIIPEVLLKYRTHSQNISVLNNDFQDKQSSEIRKMQYEKLGLDCNNQTFILFNNWIISGEIKDYKQSEVIIKFLCDLYYSISVKMISDQRILKSFFSQKTWGIICRFPTFKSYKNISEYNLIDKNVSITDKIVLLINCLKNIYI